MKPFDADLAALTISALERRIDELTLENKSLNRKLGRPERPIIFKREVFTKLEWYEGLSFKLTSCAHVLIKVFWHFYAFSVTHPFKDALGKCVCCRARPKIIFSPEITKLFGRFEGHCKIE